jgi:hypothetical protein
VLPRFHPNLIFAASSMAVIIPVESGALGDTLYEGYKKLPCEILIRLAAPLVAVTTNTNDLAAPVVLTEAESLAEAVPLFPAPWLICNHACAGVEMLQLALAETDTYLVPPPASNTMAVSETVSFGAADSFLLQKAVKKEKTNNPAKAKRPLIFIYIILFN